VIFLLIVRFLISAVVLCACTQDFDAFESGSDSFSIDGGETSDAQTPTPDRTATDVTAASDTSAYDSAMADSVVVDSAPPVDANVACTEPRSVVYENHCYFFVTGNVNWNTASNNCKSAGAHLATLSSAQEEAAVAPTGTGLEWWLGMSKGSADPAVDASFLYVTGEARTSYADWAANEPSTAGSCVRLTNGGQWGALSCTTNRYYLCERE